MNHEKRNLLLISLDTLRADVAYRGPLPSFQSLFARGTVFDHTVSSAPITPISHASVFTGLQPYEHGIRHLLRERLSTAAPTLAQLLSAAGYRTGAIASCPGLNRWYGLNVGFDHYDDEIPRLADGRDPLTTADVKMRGTALKRAPLVVERGLSWLEKNRHDPFFLFLHFFDTHWPYEPPEWYAPEGANPYEGEAAYLDHYLGKLFARLESWGLLDGGTLVVLFSDHGEDLAGWYPNDHAGAALGHPEEEGHGCLLFDATQMVPMMFLAPGLVPAGRRVDSQVRLVDILPTVTDLLGVTDTSPRSGRTLRGLFTGTEPHRTAYCEAYHREEQVAVPGLGPWRGMRIDNRFKVIFDLVTQTFRVYDLTSDPGEQRPLEYANEPISPISPRGGG
jgi:arylsulfatase A-like enzyme